MDAHLQCSCLRKAGVKGKPKSFIGWIRLFDAELPGRRIRGGRGSQNALGHGEFQVLDALAGGARDLEEREAAPGREIAQRLRRAPGPARHPSWWPPRSWACAASSSLKLANSVHDGLEIVGRDRGRWLRRHPPGAPAGACARCAAGTGCPARAPGARLRSGPGCRPPRSCGSLGSCTTPRLRLERRERIVGDLGPRR